MKPTYSTIGAALQKAKRRLARRISRDYAIVNALPLFSPLSAGPYAARAHLTLLAANQTFPLLKDLAAVAGHAAPPLVTAAEFGAEVAPQAAALARLFDHHGSDKATLHDYQHVYARILAEPTKVRSVVEIGLGSNDTSVVSNMGHAGRPGASLRAFRDYLPNAAIVGGDVDRATLFTEQRISTFFVDQTAPESFDAIERAAGTGCDLVIDDGLHAPNANLTVLLFALRVLRRGGWFVVEDIKESALPLWHVVAALMSKDYQCWLIDARGAYLFLATTK